MTYGPHAAAGPLEVAPPGAAAKADTAREAEAEGRAVTYAGLVTRAIAFAIDAAVIDGAALLVVAVVALASTVLHIPEDVKTILLGIGAAAYVIWGAGYFVAFWATTGRTLGNRVMYIRVVPAAGDRLGYRRAVQRFVGLVLAVLPLMLGLVPMLVTDRRRGLQDLLADTVVTHDPDRRAPRPGPPTPSRSNRD